jgi:Uncharacterised protein family (UPF0149)
MVNTSTNYSDDNALREALASVNADRTLHEVYGLFYGCMAAPNVAEPAQYLATICDGDHTAAASASEAAGVLDNLMSLWNFIARWKPDEEPFYFPDVAYPATTQGLQQRMADDLSLINYFISGLKLGGTEENDFDDDAIDAMHALAEAATLLQKQIEYKKTSDLKTATELIDDLEDFMADSIARVSIGLKGAKH